jgi:HD-GYP domain-containing protein (c-di-GMP phosphodiesterase class II)
MKKEVMTSLDGIEVGMFISRLDRPWINTPFDLEGMQINTKEDIAQLRKHCEYVYVDVEQGPAPDPRYWILADARKAPSVEPAQPTKKRRLRRDKEVKPGEEYQALRKTTYEVSEQFSVELQTASAISQKLSEDYHQLLNDLSRGRALDLSVVKTGVRDMVESVVRNPAAMMWIEQLKGLDEYTYSRALGTSVWCATFGRHLGLEKSAINQLALGGLLLDLGKCRLPSELLRKKGELSEEEQNLMQSHVDLGIRHLVYGVNKGNRSQLDTEVLQMIATHHERANGSGYPRKLQNREIPVYGRIAGIADSYDAMTSERPYEDKPPLRPYEAIAELYRSRETEFQAELVEQFIQAVGLYPTGSLVELNTGQVGAVVEINPLRRLQPTLLLILKANKEPYEEYEYLDLSTAGLSIKIERGLSPGAYGINMQELFL